MERMLSVEIAISGTQEHAHMNPEQAMLYALSPAISSLSTQVEKLREVARAKVHVVSLPVPSGGWPSEPRFRAAGPYRVMLENEMVTGRLLAKVECLLALDFGELIGAEGAD